MIGSSMAKLLTVLLFPLICFASGLERIEDIEGIPEVAQREYILADSNQYDYIQTYGLLTCVGLVIFDEERKLGLLAHIDAQTDLDRELPRLLKQFSKNISVSLIGGSTDLADSIKEDLQSRGIVISLNLRGIENITISLRDGEIFEYDEMFLTTPYALQSAKVDRIHFGGSRLFRHMDSLGGGDYVEYNRQNENPFGFILNY
ncbi:MAG: hypothetical protein BM556_02840 [Bacteriovorax sp. MedPE-SWde]|nr:MAG: hypothetical protein BM556_02840 [Bacteriovorax sp. MedPE-SWde]